VGFEQNQLSSRILLGIQGLRSETML